MDAASLTTGLTYKLCMDMDGANQELSFLDTGLSVQITGVTGLAGTSGAKASDL